MRAPLYAAPQDRVPMPRGRRRTELVMLVFAIGVVLFAYASVGLGMNGRIPAGILGYGLPSPSSCCWPTWRSAGSPRGRTR